MEYWWVIGVGIAASPFGWQYLIIIGCYLFLRNSRPQVGWELLFTVSIASGMRIALIVQTAFHGGSLRHHLESPLIIVVSFMLFYTQKQLLAKLLLGYF